MLPSTLNVVVCKTYHFIQWVRSVALCWACCLISLHLRVTCILILFVSFYAVCCDVKRGLQSRSCVGHFSPSRSKSTSRTTMCSQVQPLSDMNVCQRHLVHQLESCLVQFVSLTSCWVLLSSGHRPLWGNSTTW